MNVEILAEIIPGSKIFLRTVIDPVPYFTENTFEVPRSIGLRLGRTDLYTLPNPSSILFIPF
jgi:hypothetical protein